MYSIYVLCVYLHTCIYVFIYVCVYVCMCVCVYTYRRICTFVVICMISLNNTYVKVINAIRESDLSILINQIEAEQHMKYADVLVYNMSLRRHLIEYTSLHSVYVIRYMYRLTSDLVRSYFGWFGDFVRKVKSTF